eukprot:11516819-Alexandrium_andersonii.AAC.1
MARGHPWPPSTSSMISERRSSASSGRSARRPLPQPSRPVPLLAAARKRRLQTAAGMRPGGSCWHAPAPSSSTSPPYSAS